MTSALVSSCVRYSTLFFTRADVTCEFLCSNSRWLPRPTLIYAADYIIPATIWTIVEGDVTIISVCLIVSRPWFIKLYPRKLVSLLKEIPSKKSTKKSSERPDGRKGLFSTFARLSETPSAVDASRGEPFEFDIEKHQGHDVVSDTVKYVRQPLIYFLDCADQLPTNGYNPRRDGRLLRGTNRICMDSLLKVFCS